MDHKDIKLQKLARSYFGKHDLDISMADVRITYGVCTISGKIRRIPRAKVDSVEKRTEYVAGLLKTLPGIKEVVLQCAYEDKAQ